MSSTTPNEVLFTPRPRTQRNAHGSTASSLTAGARPSPRRSPRFQSLEEESATGSEDEDASPINEHGRGALSVVAAINAAVTTCPPIVTAETIITAAINESARRAPSVVVGAKKICCDIDNCVGLVEAPAMVCLLCEADIHESCFTEQIRKLKEYPVGCHNEVFCSPICCLWHGKEKIVVAEVRKERKDLMNFLKKQLVEMAKISKVRVTQRVNKKSLQVSKAMMVRRLLFDKFNPQLGDVNPEADPPRSEKTIHCRFRLINCLFSDELGTAANTSDDVDRLALDSGAVGANSQFWKLVEERFNRGFPNNSVDGPLFADKVHFDHPSIANFHETIQPSQHGEFSSSDLRSMWREMQKEYEKVFLNFKKSGNHNSSFTKAAMVVYKREMRAQEVVEAEESNGDSVSDESFDLNDAFGVEQGGFCCFTNSILMIYLRLWLNERPAMTGFVNRQLPTEIQVDSMRAPAASVKRPSQSGPCDSRSLRRSPDQLAEAINQLAKSRKVDDGKKEMHQSISKMAMNEAKKVEVTTKIEEITLLKTQIAVIKERLADCSDDSKRDKYRKGLAELEDKLDSLLFSN